MERGHSLGREVPTLESEPICHPSLASLIGVYKFSDKFACINLVTDKFVCINLLTSLSETLGCSHFFYFLNNCKLFVSLRCINTS